jgi:hypothetical protein
MRFGLGFQHQDEVLAVVFAPLEFIAELAFVVIVVMANQSVGHLRNGRSHE